MRDLRTFTSSVKSTVFGRSLLALKSVTDLVALFAGQALSVGSLNVSGALTADGNPLAPGGPQLAGVTNGSGWTVNSASLRRIGPMLSINVTVERTGASVAPTNSNQTVATFTHADAVGNSGANQGLTIYDVSTGALFRAGFFYTGTTGVLSLGATSDTIPTGGIFSLSGIVLLDV